MAVDVDVDVQISRYQLPALREPETAPDKLPSKPPDSGPSSHPLESYRSTITALLRTTVKYIGSTLLDRGPGLTVPLQVESLR